MRRRSLTMSSLRAGLWDRCGDLRPRRDAMASWFWLMSGSNTRPQLMHLQLAVSDKKLGIRSVTISPLHLRHSMAPTSRSLIRHTAPSPPLEGLSQVPGMKWLEQAGPGPQRQGPRNDPMASIACHQDNREGRMRLLDVLQDRQAIHHRHAVIGHHRVIGGLGKLLHRLPTILDRLHRMTQSLQVIP